MRWTKKSLSLRFANRKFILFLVLMETGQGNTLLLSAFSTIDTCRIDLDLHQVLMVLVKMLWCHRSYTGFTSLRGMIN